MIWHIFIKDCRLLWPGIAAAAMGNFYNSFVWARLGTLGGPREFISMGTSASIVSLFVMVLLTAAAVHQDVIPGTRQDWLVRPIRRRDLLLAKILFVLLAVHGPLFVADAIEGLMQGFSVLASGKAALVRGLSILLKYSLPAVALGAVTRNTLQVVAGVFIWVAGPTVALGGLTQIRERMVLPLNGLAWTAEATATLIVLLATAVVLWLQYGRRRTYRAIGSMVGALALSCVSAVPWQSAFAIQQWFAPQRGAGRTISVAIDRSASSPDLKGWSYIGLERVLIPIKISGLPADAILVIDDAAVRISEPGGATLYSADNRCIRFNGGGLDCTNSNITIRPIANSNGQAQIRYPVSLPTALYARVQDRSLRVEIEFSMTLLRLETTASLAGINIEQQLADGSRCIMAHHAANFGPELHCLAPHRMPGCVAVFLEDAPNGWRSPDQHSCYPDYAPYPRRIFPDAMSRLGGITTPNSGLRISGPDDQKYLEKAKIVLKTYEVQDHFTRSLALTDAHLRDWAPDSRR